MELLKVVIADDDKSSRTLLTHFIQPMPHLELVGEAESSDELILKVVQLKPDILLADIDMPGVNGLEAVKTCKTIFPHLQVIFTTGYEEFAVEAFRISAVDYVVKPIEQNRLNEAIEKAGKNIHRLQTHPADIEEKKADMLSVKQQNEYFFLKMDDILFLEKEGRKTIIHTRKERIETTEPLHEMEEHLPSYFSKTHRSYIVNLSQVFMIEASGETFLAHFKDSEKKAYISKLKIHEIQGILNH
ncbi:LytR/AlgR family response regulator transcription factor [Falsibacillus pallidus]|uniref:LytTR family two component transcriptional regulator n=1 Tax=Falsibacillus pallidus TaxID=493781 RepID=A0A370G8A1_9BACI|nr:LytTR family DNA-binding domain-containing protein [Falsibacillus pallidus]RDI40018.1 LytTR family two component transcriptional regulator [Falsibacillus pallidus]